MSYRSVLLPYENIELILVARQVDPVPTRNAPPGLLRRAGWRATGKIRPRPRATLSTWPRSKGAARRRLLNDAPLVGRPAACPLGRALPHGHVAAVRGTLRTLRVARLLAPHRSPPRARVGAARRANPRPRLAACPRPWAGRRDGTHPLGRAAGAGAIGRARPVCVPGRAAGPPGAPGARRGQAPARSRRPGARCLALGVEGRACRSPGHARAGTRRHADQAANRVRLAGRPGGLAGVGGGVCRPHCGPEPGGGRRGRRGAGGAGLPPWCGWGSGGGGPRRGVVRQGRRRGGTGSVPGAAPPSALWGTAAQGTSRGSTRRTWWQAQARPPLARG